MLNAPIYLKGTVYKNIFLIQNMQDYSKHARLNSFTIAVLSAAVGKIISLRDLCVFSEPARGRRSGR
jgi:hypothetical protein